MPSGSCGESGGINASIPDHMSGLNESTNTMPATSSGNLPA
jgi:hypothetical protein